MMITVSALISSTSFSFLNFKNQMASVSKYKDCFVTNVFFTLV